MRWIDLRNARVGFIPGPSESLLSEGRRELAAVEAPGMLGDGHKVFRDALLEEATSAPARESVLGRLADKLWLLSVRLNSALAFLFSTTEPPAMTTGFIRSAKNGSLLTRLSWDVCLSPNPRDRLLLPLRLRTAPSFP